MIYSYLENVLFRSTVCVCVCVCNLFVFVFNRCIVVKDSPILCAFSSTLSLVLLEHYSFMMSYLQIFAVILGQIVSDEENSFLYLYIVLLNLFSYSTLNVLSVKLNTCFLLKLIFLCLIQCHNWFCENDFISKSCLQMQKIFT